MNHEATVRSVSDNQDQLLLWITSLHCNNIIDVDLSYGNGSFYKKLARPQYCFDIDPQQATTIRADSRAVPLANDSVSSCIFDPPFLTYVRQGRQGNGGMIMANRFAGYWSFDDLAQHYKSTLCEASRILKHGGVMIFKCQDIIHNHKMHCTHALVIGWAAAHGFSLKDLFVLTAKHRLPAPNRKGTQKHARVFHSYFLVFKVDKRKHNK